MENDTWNLFDKHDIFILNNKRKVFRRYFEEKTLYFNNYSVLIVYSVCPYKSYIIL